MGARFGTFFSFTLFIAVYISNTACSIPKPTLPVDITGCGLIKWGMTLEQVKALLGPKAQISTDPSTGSSLETVTLKVGDMELNGFLGTELHTKRVNGVYLLYQGGRPLSPQAFTRLKLILTEKYGGPLREYSENVLTICFWRFPSGSIALTSRNPRSNSPGYVGLSYTENPLGTRFQTPLLN
jgi:hypothetical protein